MAKKSATKNPFTGRWRITSMSEWDSDFIDAEEEGYFEFDSKNSFSFTSAMSTDTSTTG